MGILQLFFTFSILCRFNAYLNLIYILLLFSIFFFQMLFDFCLNIFIVFFFSIAMVIGFYAIIPTLLYFCGIILLFCLFLHAIDFFYFSYLFLIIYVGAIAILFTYVIMLLNLHNIDVYARSKFNFYIFFLTCLLHLFSFCFFFILLTNNSISNIFCVPIRFDFFFYNFFNFYIFNIDSLRILTDLQQFGFFLFFIFKFHLLIITLLLLTALFGVLVLCSGSSIEISTRKIEFFK